LICRGVLNTLAHPRFGDPSGESPVEKATTALRTIDPKWLVEIGEPGLSLGWIGGADFRKGDEGAFPALLNRIGERLHTADRRTIAASFSLRFGWSSWVAIVPYVLNRCVPEIGLHNISLKFGANTLHERTALHVPRGAVLANENEADHPLVRSAQDSSALLRLLRIQLLEQTRPMVDALYDWSGFSKKGAWGQITSSWTSHFVNTYGRLGSQANALPVLQAFFEGDDEIGRMQPKVNPLSLGDQTHLYQRRASCCRYYLLPQGSLCASCPLVSDQERLTRNVEFMKKRLRLRTG
jgi:ferric iron reductase protein FhuF